MKINSNFEDYYYSCQYMCGEDVYFERISNLMTLTSNKELYSEKFYKAPTELLNSLNHTFEKYVPKHYKRDNTFHFSIAIIGEKIITFITEIVTLNLKEKDNVFESDKFNYKISFHFNYEDFKEKTNLKSDKNKSRYLYSSCSKILNLANEHFSNSYIDLYNNIRKKCKEPIISYSSYSDSFTDSNIPEHLIINKGTNINSNLKRLGFSKIIPSNLVIQEIEIYLNKLNSVEKESNFSDNIKIQNAGFDKKSFRHKKK